MLLPPLLLSPHPPTPTHTPFRPQVLGTGELTTKLVIKAAAFSETARQKIEAAGGQVVELPQKATWTRKAHEARVAAAAAAK